MEKDSIGSDYVFIRFLFRFYGLVGFFENQGTEFARNELHIWIQEQIYGATAEAESKVQNTIYKEENTVRNGPVFLDVDALIETSLDRR